MAAQTSEHLTENKREKLEKKRAKIQKRLSEIEALLQADAAAVVDGAKKKDRKEKTKGKSGPKTKPAKKR